MTDDTAPAELLLAPFFYRFTERDDGNAWACGGQRLADATKGGARDRMGDNSHLHHYWGALGEIAAARFLGIPIARRPGCWSCPTKRWNKPDVISPIYGPFEVRAIPSSTIPYLKTKANDNEAVPILSVLLCAKTSAVPFGMAIVQGWASPSEIRAHGDMQDWGGRGAAAWMTRDLTFLHTTFSPQRTPTPSPASATPASSTAPTSRSTADPDGGSAKPAPTVTTG